MLKSSGEKQCLMTQAQGKVAVATKNGMVVVELLPALAAGAKNFEVVAQDVLTLTLTLTLTL